MTQNITGYRKLSDEEVALMNQANDIERQVAEFLSRAFDAVRRIDGGPSEGTRQISIARTELEGGFMRLRRGIARPVSPWKDQHHQPRG